MKTILLGKTKSVLKISFVFVAALMMSMSLNSCEADDSGSSTNCEEDLTELAQIMNQNSSAFSQNPTKANCDKLKASALKLIEKAKKCGYEEEWAAVTAAWEDIDCSDLDN